MKKIVQQKLALRMTNEHKKKDLFHKYKVQTKS